MSEPDEIRLWCWVLGDAHTRVFPVDIKRSAPIHFLKRAIHEQKPSFKVISVDSIDLYKFQLPLEDFNEDYAQSINLEGGQEKLNSFNDVSFYWKKEPGKVLSVILPRPAGTTITPPSFQNSNLSLNSPPSWLVDIHGELWGQRDFFGKIFRTATLTKDDFNELQALLDEQNPERISDTYVAEDVLATKSAFLRVKSTPLSIDFGNGLAPRLVFDASSDAVANDDTIADDAMDTDPDHCSSDLVDPHMAHLSNEAKAIFPYTIRYVDLTVLKLKEYRVPQANRADEEAPSLQVSRASVSTTIGI
ncbi:hypothetical protein M378DRAFT_10964 [Amanita muscaria Koide BX008]|uniref:Crinkler effector protein N-terminal domain-containing protein n=1 Tax=Amanita muscaria (strain Koide BX008) TaxID=946122 RepID=A0A0C2X712_AMAMK|nr:hypothetical protein M378DRAFT_10964 [Amanita muscaria Koide BX008]